MIAEVFVMQENGYWKRFESTGAVGAYLDYKAGQGAFCADANGHSFRHCQGKPAAEKQVA